MRRSTVFLVALLLLLAAGDGALALSTSDTYKQDLWNIDKIGAEQAWGVSTGAGVKVGIVDSGVDAGHPDLGGRVVESTACVNGAGCGGSGDDIQGHGTHVAGIIAATKNNGEGVAGVAPSAQLVVARVFDSDSTSVEDIRAGRACWVVEHGARVVNFSLGDAGFFGLGLFVSNNDVRAVANEVWNMGAIPVVTAGNNSCGGWASTNAVVVTATGPSDEWSGYACAPSGAQWGVAAPGGNASDCGSQPAKCVLSTYARSHTPSGKAPYAYEQGTSMAAPAVTGALASLLAKGLSREGAISALMTTLDPANCGTSCQGRINVARAVCGSSCPAVVPTPGGGGGTPSPPPVTPTTAFRPPVRRNSTTPTTRRPAAPAPTTVVPAPTTTIEEATTTTTTEPPPRPRLQSAAPRRSSDDDDIGPLPGILAVLGLLGAAGATGLAGWRQRFRGGGAL